MDLTLSESNGVRGPPARFPPGAIAKMRELRAERWSYRRIGNHFGTDEATAWHHTHDVQVREEEPQLYDAFLENSETPSSMSDPLEQKVPFSIPMELSRKTIVALWAAANQAGYDSPDEYVEGAILNARRTEGTKTRRVEYEPTSKYNEPSPTHIVKPEPWTLERGILDIKKAYLTGLELQMLMSSIEGKKVIIDPPEWLFPEYYKEKREEEARQAAETRRLHLLDVIRICERQGRSPEDMGKFLRMMGVTDRELVDIVLPEIRRLHGLGPTVSDLGRNPSPNSPMSRYLSSSD